MNFFSGIIICVLACLLSSCTDLLNPDTLLKAYSGEKSQCVLWLNDKEVTIRFLPPMVLEASGVKSRISPGVDRDQLHVVWKKQVKEFERSYLKVTWIESGAHHFDPMQIALRANQQTFSPKGILPVQIDKKTNYREILLMLPVSIEQLRLAKQLTLEVSGTSCSVSITPGLLELIEDVQNEIN